MPADLQHVVPDCREFAQTVEAMLAHRRARGTRSAGQVWTRDEVCDLAYASYKALLRGVVRHPPRRVTVLGLADYLECTLAERNHLLLAAGRAPEQPDLQGEALAQVLAVAEDTLPLLPFPAISVTRDWTVHGLNARMLSLFGLTPAEVAAVPLERRTLLHLVFDPRSPLYPWLGGGSGVWEQTARRDVLVFQRHNALSRHDAWYTSRVRSLMALPRFEDLWNDVQAALRDEEIPEHLPHEIPCFDPAEQPFTLRALWIGLTDLDYPRVVAYVPADDRAREVLAALGPLVPV